jgi:hypothetical protein
VNKNRLFRLGTICIWISAGGYFLGPVSTFWFAIIGCILLVLS